MRKEALHREGPRKEQKGKEGVGRTSYRESVSNEGEGTEIL